MLSPITVDRIPKDPEENLELRCFLLGQTDPKVRRQLWHACSQDILFFINLFIWQYNPQQVGDEVGPFITWDFQDEAVREILAVIERGNRCDLVIEKSREMGASWLCLIVMLWLFLFHPWKKFLLISRSAEAVDKPEEPDSLMWKLDFMLSHLPSWLRGNVSRRKMGFRNRDNQSTITGQASTGKSGVGGRATAMFVDEFSQIDEDYEVLHRTADTTGCRIFNFTHTGLDRAAYEMSQRVDVRKLRMHWSQHPQKNKGLYRHDLDTQRVEIIDKSYPFPPDYPFVLDGTPGGPFPGLRSPWYDAEEKRRQSKRAVAMDLDIDPRGATAQFFDAALIKSLQATYACAPYWEGDIYFDHDLGRPLNLIARQGGPVKLWCRLDTHGRPPLSTYTGGADLATGSGATPSCIAFINARTGEKVMEYANAFLDPLSLAPLAVALCWLFKDENGDGAALAWEMQGPGLNFGKKVIELGYRNVYYRSNEHSLNNEISDIPGWVPTPNNIRVVLEDYRAALATRQFINRSWPALDECLSFVYDGTGKVKHGGSEATNDPTGARENHGDRVVADALAWKMGRSYWSLRRVREEEPVTLNTLAGRRLLHDNLRKRQEAWQ